MNFNWDHEFYNKYIIISVAKKNRNSREKVKINVGNLHKSQNLFLKRITLIKVATIISP